MFWSATAQWKNASNSNNPCQQAKDDTLNNFPSPSRLCAFAESPRTTFTSRQCLIKASSKACKLNKITKKLWRLGQMRRRQSPKKAAAVICWPSSFKDILSFPLPKHSVDTNTTAVFRVLGNCQAETHQSRKAITPVPSTFSEQSRVTRRITGISRAQAWRSPAVVGSASKAGISTSHY